MTKNLLDFDLVKEMSEIKEDEIILGEKKMNCHFDNTIKHANTVILNGAENVQSKQ